MIRVDELKDSGLIARKIGTYTLINCASPSYLSRFGMPTRLEDLSSHAVVHYSQRSASRRSALNISTASSATTCRPAAW
nr:LysR family transcriptional regulator [Candidatus Pantoea persica]